MNDREYFKILRQLEEHHSLFGRFWSIGSLVEDEKIKTACITFDRKSGDGVQFKVNPKFWEECSDYKKVFVLAHECLHVYLEHGRRMKHMDRNIANIAADVVVNHYLVDGFGFDRDKVEGWQQYCWLDTVFKDRDDVAPYECLEYYYKLLMQQKQQEQDGKGKPKKGKKGDGPSGAGGGKGQKGDGEEQDGEGSGNGQEGEEEEKKEGEGEEDGEPETVDSHEEFEELTEEVLDEIVRKLSEKELESFQDITEEANKSEKESASKMPGSTAGSMSRIIMLRKVVKKKKWEEVVKNVLGRLCKEKDVIVEQWAHPNRRLAAFPSGELLLPNEIDDTILHRDRIDVWFFQDTSGSCESLADRFFKAAASIPDDKFRIRMFCFDTNTYETSIKSGKLYGFGGTTYTCIEECIQRTMQAERGTLYPSVVFILTDGYGNNVNPKHPDRWHWFLTEGGARNCIPTQSKIYDLAKYE